MAYPNRSSYKGACNTEPFPLYFYADNFNRRCAFHHIWSGHPGGGNFTFGDGSVRFMAYTAANPVLVNMASASGGEVVSE
jgi:prepilin-type processing-associated H-X9-DG protein